MKYAVIADIHANLEALDVVLDDSRAQNCTHYCCVGDVVGYNANPKECLDIIRNMNMPCVKGNHDEYCSTDEALDGFNPHAAEAVNWTRKQLTEEDRQWLRDMKYVRLVGSFSMVHATLDGPQRWGYVFDKLAAAASFTYQNTSVCFFGLDIPKATPESVAAGILDGVERGEDEIFPDPLSAPVADLWRDGVAKATYVIYDLNEQSIELRRLDYDIPKAQKKILEAGLPPRLAERLAYGK